MMEVSFHETPEYEDIYLLKQKYLICLSCQNCNKVFEDSEVTKRCYFGCYENFEMSQCESFLMEKHFCKECYNEKFKRWSGDKPKENKICLDCHKNNCWECEEPIIDKDKSKDKDNGHYYCFSCRSNYVCGYDRFHI